MRVDLRSDTITRPTPAMREAMMHAKVGDDVFGEDSTINALEEKICKMFNMDMAVFMPTATMANQIALQLHTRPLDEIICDSTSHIYNYEVGGYAHHAGCAIKCLHGERGIFSAGDVLQNIQPEDVHKPKTKLVCLENTVNRGGGAIFPMQNIEAIHKVCKENALGLHIDGSRLFNAMVATGTEPSVFGKITDTLTLCFSKGLGCPAGAILTGQKKYMQDARRVRKVMGGGMRQAGILAAACLFALDHHIARLAEDHALAASIAQILGTSEWTASILPVETNILIFQLRDAAQDKNFIAHLAENDIHAFAIGGGWIRFVTHLDVNNNMLPQIQEALKTFRL